MSDTFTTVTSESWFSRIGGAFKGIIVGLLLFCVAFPLLFWNEGRAVKTYKSLKEGQRAVVSVAVDSVVPANEGKLIHVTGTATTTEVLTDPVFGISAPALKLKRVVEYYQWTEKSHDSTQKKLGGGSETTTTYEYQLAWVTDPIDSTKFKSPAGHENTTFARYDDLNVGAGIVTCGAFRLSPSLLSRLDNFTAFPINPAVTVPALLKDKVHLTGSGFYAGKEPTAPQIGDARISFLSVVPTEISIVSRQTGTTFTPYATSTGKSVELLETGVHSAAEMFQTARTHNKVLTSVLRVVGFALMLFGLAGVFRPLAVLADVVPFLGSLVGAGTFFIAFLAAAALSVVTVAVAWIVYRPLLGGALLVVAVGLAVAIKQKLKRPVAVPQPVDPVTS